MMEQGQYQYHPEDARPVKRPENRFLWLWGPLLVKWGIAMGVSMAAVFLFEGMDLIREAGIDFPSPEALSQIQLLIQKYMSDKDSMNELAYRVNEEISKYMTPIEGISALITIPFLWFMFHKDRIKEKVGGYIPNVKAALWKYIGVIMISLALTLGINNLLIISGISESSSDYTETMEALYSSPLPVQFLCLGILIPVCEELVFRGLMFRRLRQSGGFKASAAYSSVVFALFHMNIVQMLYALFLGFVFCYLYEKYGSVKAPILAHVVSNTFSVALTNTDILGWMAEDSMRMGMVTVLCAAISSTAYVLIQRIDEKPDTGEAASEGKEENVKM